MRRPDEIKSQNHQRFQGWKWISMSIIGKVAQNGGGRRDALRLAHAHHPGFKCSTLRKQRKLQLRWFWTDLRTSLQRAYYITLCKTTEFSTQQQHCKKIAENVRREGEAKDERLTFILRQPWRTARRPLWAAWLAALHRGTVDTVLQMCSIQARDTSVSVEARRRNGRYLDPRAGPGGLGARGLISVS